MQLEGGSLTDCGDKKFFDLSQHEQKAFIEEHFRYKDGKWFDQQGEFAETSSAEFIAALIDYENAVINSIGDCMAGFCALQPKFSQFVRK